MHSFEELVSLRAQSSVEDEDTEKSIKVEAPDSEDED